MQRPAASVRAPAAPPPSGPAATLPLPLPVGGAPFGGPRSNSAPVRGTVILCVGDSLTAGTRANNDSYPLHLEKFLNRSGHSYKAENAGVWGQDCDSIMGRLHGSIAAATKHGALAFALVLAGTNDILAYTDASTVLGRLGRIHAALEQAPGRPRIGVFTLPPCAKFTPVQEQARLQLNESLRDLCNQYGNRERFLVDLENMSPSLSVDGIHYSGEGHVEFAQLALDAIRSQLGVLRPGQMMPTLAG